MELTHMSVDAKHIRNFLDSCDGNWHGCIYVTCSSCRFPDTCREPGFLFHPNEMAAPLLLPLCDAKILFAQIPEPEECLCTMSVARFLSMYGNYLNKLNYPEDKCPCMVLLKDQEESNYDW